MNIFRCALQVSSTHPGEDIHHTVISCVGINVSYPYGQGLRFYVLSEKTKQCE